jgi:2-polyprenyl-6-methoxyphenol hydroxylase-like FAD-dependent oxidoreductase
VLAVTLGKYSTISVHVYESQSEIATAGAGVSFWNCSREIFKDLGMDEDVVAKSTFPPAEERLRMHLPKCHSLASRTDAL